MQASTQRSSEVEQAWGSRANVDFSFCLFLNKKTVEHEKETEVKASLNQQAAEVGSDVKLIQLATGTSRFDGFKFPGGANFFNAVFMCMTHFRKSSFAVYAIFRRTIFRQSAIFCQTTICDKADFHSTSFKEFVFFSGSTFNGQADFQSATFSNNADFSAVNFIGSALFGSTIFSSNAEFCGCKFASEASFREQTFSKYANFSGVRFGPKGADFGLAIFEQVALFDCAKFEGEANFNAMAGRHAFGMAGACFKRVPDFIQAHFEEAPRLDNVHVESPEELELLTEKEARNLVARWRELKRLAIQAHDTDRELEFNAREIRAERTVSRWPRPPKFRDGKGWRAWVRALSSALYGFFSDYGRSLFRPFLWWIAFVAIFAAFYLSQTEAMQTGRYAMWQSVPCYPAPTYAENWRSNWKMWERPKTGPSSFKETAFRILDAIKAFSFWPLASNSTNSTNSNETTVGGLGEKLRSQTNARAEALHLAFRNAFVVLDGGSDATHRMYGCLYGLELYAGQNPVPIVPGAVSTASAIQKLISGVLIFLFGLALRNMLKVK